MLFSHEFCAYDRSMDGLRLIAEERLRQRVINLRRLMQSCASLSIAVSGLVLLAWLTHATWLETAAPWIMEMKANTALGFASAAISLLLCMHERHRVAMAFAVVPIAIGLATIVELVARTDFGIDQLLAFDWSKGAGALPGRAPPNAMIALLMLGGSVWICELFRSGRIRNMAIRIITFSVVVIGMEAIAGQIFHSHFAIGWGTAQRMSIPSAICAIALGIGLAAHSWESEVTAITRLPVWIPALLCFGLVLFDTYTSTDVDAGICYTLLVLCALWFERADVSLIFAGIATLLILLGVLSSPPGQAPFASVVLNRSLAIGAVWLVAVLIYLRHGSNRKLRQSERHLASAQRLAAIGSFELGFARMNFSASQAFGEMLGLNADATHDWDSFLRTSVSPDDRSAIARVIEATRAGAQPDDLQFAYLDAAAHPRNGLMHLEPLLDAEGHPAGLLGVVQDVTALRQAEASRSDIEFQLRHAQKLEALGLCAGGIAHDINNTLVPIATLTPLLLATSSGPQQRESLEVIMNSARRAKALVREMLVFSRKEPAAYEALRLDQLARDALTLIRAGIPANIDIVDELEVVPEIIGSRGQLYQTLLNLAINAAQAIGSHAGRIVIGSSRVSGRDGDTSSVRFYIVDDGSGMDEATRARIFEPFFSTKGPRQGTGLGLSIVSGIVTSHGGTIRVESAPGKGTRFDLLFPAIETKFAA